MAGAEEGFTSSLFDTFGDLLIEEQKSKRATQQTIVDRLLASEGFDIVPKSSQQEGDIALKSLPDLVLRRLPAEPDIGRLERLKALIDFGNLAAKPTETGKFIKKKGTVGDPELIQQILGEITSALAGDQPSSGKVATKSAPADTQKQSLLDVVGQALEQFTPKKRKDKPVTPTPSRAQAPTKSARPGEQIKPLSRTEEDDFLELFNSLTPQQQEAALEDPEIRQAFKEAQAGNSP